MLVVKFVVLGGEFAVVLVSWCTGVAWEEIGIVVTNAAVAIEKAVNM